MHIHSYCLEEIYIDGDELEGQMQQDICDSGKQKLEHVHTDCTGEQPLVLCNKPSCMFDTHK